MLPASLYIVLQPRYDVMMYVQQVTMLMPGCGQSSLSAGQWGTGEEGRSCFSMVQSKWAKV